MNAPVAYGPRFANSGPIEPNGVDNPVVSRWACGAERPVLTPLTFWGGRTRQRVFGLMPGGYAARLGSRMNRGSLARVVRHPYKSLAQNISPLRNFMENDNGRYQILTMSRGPDPKPKAVFPLLSPFHVTIRLGNVNVLNGVAAL
jgi:hypothetical protein